MAQVPGFRDAARRARALRFSGTAGSAALPVEQAYTNDTKQVRSNLRSPAMTPSGLLEFLLRTADAPQVLVRADEEVAVGNGDRRIDVLAKAVDRKQFVL